MIDPWHLEVLARTLFGESRGEPRTGQVAVAWVVVNRCTDLRRRWPTSVAACCMAAEQFSTWWTPDANWLATVSTSHDDPTMVQCRTVASDVLSGDLADPTLGANHFLTVRLALTRPPRWYDPSKVTVDIGRQRFLKL